MGRKCGTGQKTIRAVPRNDGGLRQRHEFLTAGALNERGVLTHDGFWHENWLGSPTQKALGSENEKGWEGRFLQLMDAITKSPLGEEMSVSSITLL